MKTVFFIIIFLLFIQEGSAQETSYKDSVIALLKQTRKGVKVYNNHDKDAKRKYFYHKKTKRMVAVVIAPEKSHSAFEYKYINGELVWIQIYLPYSAMPSSVGKEMYGVYFFKNNILVDKDELNFPQLDIEQYKIQGLELFKQAVQFFEKRGIRLDSYSFQQMH